MKLTETQTQEVIRRLNEFSHGGISCPICRQRHWILNDVVIESREFQNGNLVIGGESAVVPFVSLTCSNCGNSLLFNALHLGVVTSNNRTGNTENHG